jgi:hypothetical protein
MMVKVRLGSFSVVSFWRNKGQIRVGTGSSFVRFHSFLGGVLASLLITGVFGFSRSHSGAAASTAPPAGSPVVVELFTSEGCSSCPPADALLARLAEQPSLENVQVIALEEHVDYWNDQGWIDPFSSREWTARQYSYAGTLGNRNPYTPQMVVDGSAEFVGSHTQKALNSIAEAARRTKIAVTLSQGSPKKPGTEDFAVTVGKLPETTKNATADVWLAITESGLHSTVSGGENAGHNLHHAAIVRAMRKIGEAKGSGDTSFSGDASVSLRSEWKRENLKAVVFVQEKKSLRIIGATQISVHP